MSLAGPNRCRTSNGHDCPSRADGWRSQRCTPGLGELRAHSHHGRARHAIWQYKFLSLKQLDGVSYLRAARSRGDGGLTNGSPLADARAPSSGAHKDAKTSRAGQKRPAGEKGMEPAGSRLGRRAGARRKQNAAPRRCGGARDRDKLCARIRRTVLTRRHRARCGRQKRNRPAHSVVRGALRCRCTGPPGEDGPTAPVA